MRSISQIESSVIRKPIVVIVVGILVPVYIFIQVFTVMNEELKIAWGTMEIKDSFIRTLAPLKSAIQNAWQGKVNRGL